MPSLKNNKLVGGRIKNLMGQASGFANSGLLSWAVNVRKRKIVSRSWSLRMENLRLERDQRLSGVRSMIFLRVFMWMSLTLACLLRVLMSTLVMGRKPID